MLSGAIQASFDPLAFVLSFLQNGSLRALAVGADAPSPSRSRFRPRSRKASIIATPPGTASWRPGKRRAVLKTLADAIAKASQDPDLKAKLSTQGIDQQLIATDAFDKYIDDDVAHLAPLIKSVAVKR